MNLETLVMIASVAVRLAAAAVVAVIFVGYPVSQVVTTPVSRCGQGVRP